MILKATVKKFGNGFHILIPTKYANNKTMFIIVPDNKDYFDST